MESQTDFVLPTSNARRSLGHFKRGQIGSKKSGRPFEYPAVKEAFPFLPTLPVLDISLSILGRALKAHRRFSFRRRKCRPRKGTAMLTRSTAQGIFEEKQRQARTRAVPTATGVAEPGLSWERLAVAAVAVLILLSLLAATVPPTGNPEMSGTSDSRVVPNAIVDAPPVGDPIVTDPELVGGPAAPLIME